MRTDIFTYLFHTVSFCLIGQFPTVTLGPPQVTGVCGQGMSNVFAAPPIKYFLGYQSLNITLTLTLNPTPISDPNRNPNRNRNPKNKRKQNDTWDALSY